MSHRQHPTPLRRMPFDADYGPYTGHPMDPRTDDGEDEEPEEMDEPADEAGYEVDAAGTYQGEPTC